MTSTAGQSQLSERIRSARFGAVRRGEGYRKRPVDDLLHWMAQAVEAGEVVDGVIDAIELHAPSRLEKGYDAQQVDAFVREVREATAALRLSPPGAVARGYRILKAFETVEFSAGRLREGYDVREVDDLLDRLKTAVENGESVAPMVHAAQLRRGRMRDGYDVEQVDAFLQRLMA